MHLGFGSMVETDMDLFEKNTDKILNDYSHAYYSNKILNILHLPLGKISISIDGY